MKFTTMITGIAAASTTVTAMAIPRPWIPMDAANYRRGDASVEERTNNPDIQDQYPCWGCKRDQVNSGVQVDSALNTLETTRESTPDKRTNDADIQERGGPEVYEAHIMPGSGPHIHLPVDPTLWYKQNDHPGTKFKEWMWKMLDPYVRPIVKTKIELGEFGEHPEDQPGYDGVGQPIPEGCVEFDWGVRCEK